jgi:hypothetical protein
LNQGLGLLQSEAYELLENVRVLFEAWRWSLAFPTVKSHQPKMRIFQSYTEAALPIQRTRTSQFMVFRDCQKAVKSSRSDCVISSLQFRRASDGIQTASIPAS